MGNSIMIKRKRVKVMKIDGEVFCIKILVMVREVMVDYFGYVLLDFEVVKYFGVCLKLFELS